jgi:hypothetical protein
MKNFDYEKTIQLKHEEVAAKVNLDTGELKLLEGRTNNIPTSKEIFEPSAMFGKYYQNSWNFLIKYLTSAELGIVATMCNMCDMNTNSLKPLDDNTTIHEIMQYFDISEKKVKDTFKKLFELGVYGRFEVADVTKDYTKYWIVNPYLCFRGRTIDKSISNLFKGTRVANAFKDKDYVPTGFLKIKRKTSRRQRD